MVVLSIQLRTVSITGFQACSARPPSAPDANGVSFRNCFSLCSGVQLKKWKLNFYQTLPEFWYTKTNKLSPAIIYSQGT